MESFFSRYRNLVVLLIVLLAQIIGLAMQVRHTDSGRNLVDVKDGTGVRLIRLWADWIVTPPEQILHGTKLGALNLWGNYIALRHTREQNQDLQKTIDRLRLEQAALLEDARQGQRLQAIEGFQQKYIYKTLAAQAIGSSGSDQSRVFYIDKGADYKLERDMAVITADGIVGKVREVFPHTSQVLAINDQSSGAGVILETTRIRGILRGNSAGRPQIVGILADQRIQPGEKVLTAGGDQIFPRGLPVGVVEKIVRDPDRDSFIDVIVKPAAHLERLDEVLVITSTESRFAPEQQQDLATSESLMGAEAAAIKEQKKASEIMAERLPGLTDPNAPKPAAPPAAGETATPGQTPATPPVAPAPKLLPAKHPDRYMPGSAFTPPHDQGDSAPDGQEKKPSATPETKPLAKPESKPQAKPPIKPQPRPEPKTPQTANPLPPNSGRAR
jgi:rod shape-determining protein MreC